MAYKFQVGPAILSGSTTFEEAVSAASLSSAGAISAASLSASAGVSGASFDSDGDATFGTITMPGFAVDADGDVALKSLAVDNGSTIGADGDTDILTLAAQSAVLANDVDFNVAKVGGLQLAGAAVTSTAAELNLLDAVTRGSIIYGNGSGASAKLAKGAAHTFLQSDGTDISYVAMSGDATLVAGELSIGAIKVTDAMINDDVAAALAGDGLAAASGVLAVGVDDSTIETDTDALRVKDLGITRAKLAADAVDGTKLADDAVDSEHIADGSIDTAHIADAQVTVAKMAANSVDSDQYVDGSIDTAHIADDQVTLAKMAGIARGKILVGDASGDPSALAAGSDGKLLVADANGDPSWTTVSGDATLSAGVLTLTADSVDSDQYIDGSIDTAHIADAQVTVAKMAANSVDSDQYVDGSIDTAHIADAQVTEAKLATSVAGVGLSGGGGSALAVDLNELVAEQVASGDFFAFVDSTDNGTHKETVDDLATLFAGNGLSAASAVMALDLNELTAAAINVANDSFAIIDADASNGSRKESFVDYASAIAGGGLTALNGGLLVTGNNVMAIADSGTLAAGYNIFANLSAPATVTLPASPEVGASVTVKGKGGVSQSNYIQINRAGSSQLIDGEESVRIESVYGAVTMVYVGSDDWRIV